MTSLGILPLAFVLTLLLLTLWGCGAGRAPTATPPPLLEPATPTGTQRYVDEPIFGGRIFLYEAGPERVTEHSRTVLLVHGLSRHGVSDWRHVIPGLAREHRVVAVDLPGFARSDRFETLYSPERYSEFLHWLIHEEIHPGSETRRPVVLVGHSLGGALGLFHAGRHPEDMERLVVLDVAGVLHRSSFLKSLARVPRGTAVGDAPEVAEVVNRVFGWMIERTDNLTIDMPAILADPSARTRYFRDDPAAVAGTALLELDFSRSLDALEVPTLVLWGKRDEVAPLRTGWVLASRIPDVRLELIEGAGHSPMKDQPQETERLLVEALRDWPAAAPLKLPEMSTSERDHTCEGTDEQLLVGAYRHIRVGGCERVRMIDVSARSIHLNNASVEITGLRIDGDDIGLFADDSIVEITFARIEADTALLVGDSRVDLADVTLVGREHAARAVEGSGALFSLCRVESPHGDGIVHGAYDLTPGAPI